MDEDDDEEDDEEDLDDSEPEFDEIDDTEFWAEVEKFLADSLQWESELVKNGDTFDRLLKSR